MRKRRRLVFPMMRKSRSEDEEMICYNHRCPGLSCPGIGNGCGVSAERESEKSILYPLDFVDDAEPCVCGSKGWIVDGDGEGKFWKLCLDNLQVGCVQTKELSAIQIEAIKEGEDDI